MFKKFINGLVGVLLIVAGIAFSRYLDGLSNPAPVPTPTPIPTPIPTPAPVVSKIYVVGLVNKVDANTQEMVWALEGVYDSEDKAKAKCVTPYHFVGPTTINKDLPADGVWPDAYFPLAKITVQEAVENPPSDIGTLPDMGDNK